MFKFALVVLFCATAYARPNIEIDPHVVGGKEAKEGQFPFVVSIRLGSEKYHLCGGALISDRYVVTAAQCLHSKEPYSVAVGSIDICNQTIHEVDKIIPHPEHDPENRTNDIGLIRLKTPVTVGGNVQTINFPINEDLSGKSATGMGWGRIFADGPFSDILLYFNARVIDSEECGSQLKIKIRDTQLCFGGKWFEGMCYGDSGSPLLYKGTDGKNYIAGVVSWGIPCAVGFPDIFTRVSAYTDWIKENMK